MIDISSKQKVNAFKGGRIQIEGDIVLRLINIHLVRGIKERLWEVCVKNTYGKAKKREN